MICKRTRTVGEQITVTCSPPDEQIIITVLEIHDGGAVTFSIEAPDDFNVHRLSEEKAKLADKVVDFIRRNG